MNNYVFYDGAWHQVDSRWFGHDGQWRQERVRLVGYNGLWTEVMASEGNGPTSSIAITSISDRAGTPMQGGVTLKGYNLSNLVYPQPLDYGFWPLTGNYADALDDFGSISPHGNEMPVFTSDNGGGCHLTGSSLEYLSLPLGNSGYDLLGLLGATGNNYFCFIIKVFPTNMTPEGGTETFLMHSGNPGARIYLKYNVSGDVVFGWDNGVTVQEIALLAALTPLAWTGIMVEHIPGVSPQGTVNVKSSFGLSASYTGSLPYFPPVADTPILLGTGAQVTGTGPSANYFTATNAFSIFTIPSGYTIQNATNTWGSATPGLVISRNTGKYYLEFTNGVSYDIQFGVAPPGCLLSNPPGMNGWCVNTFAGKKFAKQSGGGTTWSTAIPVNSIIGLLYDSDNGQIEVFVNGVSRGRPFAEGTITGDVCFIIGGRGYTSTGNIMSATVSLVGLVYPVSESLSFPATTESFHSATYANATVRGLVVRNTPLADSDTVTAMMQPMPVYQVLWERMSDGIVSDGTDSVLQMRDDQLTIGVPPVAPGNYLLHINNAGLRTVKRMFSILPFVSSQTPLQVDFATVSRADMETLFIRAHKAWGGANGGVIAENVRWMPEQGIVRCAGLGDQYTGPLRGVDRMGNRTATPTRIGGCLVTREYYGPGSYRIVARLPAVTGLCSGIWTFHYEEAYPGTPLWTSLQADGLNVSGNEADGYYMVRNHEIDIETPVALAGAMDREDVSYANANFNTWRGEHDGEYTVEAINHGIPINDGNFHEFRFDWHTVDPDTGEPSCTFRIDGIETASVTTHVPDIPQRLWVGLWFPSAAVKWAGAHAAFSEVYFDIKSITILPYNEPFRDIGETYPNIGFRDFFSTLPT